jgi:hypothetical protein
MTRTSIANYDPLADDDDDSFDPVAIWEANRPFEELNRRMNPMHQATAKQARIHQLRCEIASLEATVSSANEMLTGRKDELANLMSHRPSGKAPFLSSHLEIQT